MRPDAEDHGDLDQDFFKNTTLHLLHVLEADGYIIFLEAKV